MDDFGTEGPSIRAKHIIKFGYPGIAVRHLEDPRYYKDPLVESIVIGASKRWSEVTRNSSESEEYLLLKSVVEEVAEKVPSDPGSFQFNHDSERISESPVRGVGGNCQDQSVAVLAVTERLFSENNLPFAGVLLAGQPKEKGRGHLAVLDLNSGLVSDASYHSGVVTDVEEYQKHYPHLTIHHCGSYDSSTVDREGSLTMIWGDINLTDETTWPEHEKSEPTFLHPIK